MNLVKHHWKHVIVELIKIHVAIADYFFSDTLRKFWIYFYLFKVFLQVTLYWVDSEQH